MTYLQQKYQYIFGIDITKGYIIYLSLYELQKKFAKNNQDICIFYSREKQCIVDGNGNKFESFPFLKKAKIKLITDFTLFAHTLKDFLETQTSKNLNFTLLNNNINIKKNYAKIEISENTINSLIEFDGSRIESSFENVKKFETKHLLYQISEKKGKIKNKKKEYEKMNIED